jgi:hypothetical protein
MVANIRRGDDASRERLCHQSLQKLSNRDVHGATVQLLCTVVRNNKVNKTGQAMHNFIAPHKNPLLCACLAHSLYLWWMYEAPTNPKRLDFPDLLQPNKPADDTIDIQTFRATHWLRQRLIINPGKAYKEMGQSGVHNLFKEAFKRAGVTSGNKKHAARKFIQFLTEMGVSETGVDSTGHWSRSVRTTHYNNGQQTDAILASAGFSPTAKYYFIPELNIVPNAEMDELRAGLIYKYFPNMTAGAVKVRDALISGGHTFRLPPRVSRN